MEEAGKLRVAGVIQEQHADRARLFMQWHQMTWPVLVDAFNELGVSVVPITLLVDEHGVIRRVVPRGAEPAEEIRRFLEAEYAAPEESTRPEGVSRALAPDVLEAPAGTRRSELIRLLTEELKRRPGDGPATFRLGVAFRRRFDSDERRPGDFQAAVDHWNRALAIDPNNYIWRRRLQQYGPRPAKPYPFYDWLDLARQAVLSRGETPVELAVEPGPAEKARPTTLFALSGDVATEPDAQGRIHRDAGKLIHVDTTAVSVGNRAGGAVRAYVLFRPDGPRKAHWNNESRGVALWLKPARGWDVEQQSIQLPNPAAAVSTEPRDIEFEIRRNADDRAATEIAAYALYYICEGRGGTCLYRRQDLTLALPDLPAARDGR